MQSVPDEEKRIIVAAEAHKQESELGLGAQKKTRGQPVKN
jgi:hypothetical protein